LAIIASPTLGEAGQTTNVIIPSSQSM